MAYQIVNPQPLKVIGYIKLGGNDWRTLVELSDWDREQDADYRWVSNLGNRKYPYLVQEDGTVVCNPTHATGLLKHKEGTKSTFFIMGDDEQWLEEDPRDRLYAYQIEDFSDEPRKRYSLFAIDANGQPVGHYFWSKKNQ